MNFGRRNDDVPEINIISMVDVVLVILLFFMATTSFTKQSLLKLDLPSASKTQVKEPEAPITVDVASSGVFHVNGKEHPASALAEILRELATDSPERALVLRADRRAIQEDVVKVLDAARQAGIQRVRIAAQHQ